MNTPHVTEPPSSTRFADRIKLLIQRVGSATEIARMCGFSEGVVRSWRDGNTDPSRARCVTLARTLGISLVWLVAGEGSLQGEKAENGADGNSVAQGHQSSVHALGDREHGARAVVDAHRLSVAIQMLQSQISLTESQLSLGDSGELLAELYEIISDQDDHVDPGAMMVFNHHLSERLHRDVAA